MHRGGAGCDPSQKRFCSDGTCDTGDCNEDVGEMEVNGAPDESCFEGNEIASYYDLSIWTSDAVEPVEPSFSGVSMQ